MVRYKTCCFYLSYALFATFFLIYLPLRSFDDYNTKEDRKKEEVKKKGPKRQATILRGRWEGDGRHSNQTTKKMTKEDYEKMMEIAPDFKAELLNNAQDILKNYDEFVLFTMINSAYHELTMNWLCNVAPMPHIHDRLLIVSTDFEACDKVWQVWPNILCLSSQKEETNLNSALKWGQQAYVNFLTVRAAIISLLVKENIKLVLFETDAVWLRDPIQYFHNYSSDAGIVLPLKGYPEGTLTLSFDPMIIRPSDSTKSFFTEMTKLLTADPKLYDQDVLDGLCKQQYAGVYCATFPWDEVSDGLWYKLSSFEQRNVRPYVINNNYIIGVNSKINRQALNGHWFLKPGKNGECDLDKAESFLNKPKSNMLVQVKLNI